MFFFFFNSLGVNCTFYDSKYVRKVFIGVSIADIVGNMLVT